jgi:drug/metabolite transporter (DMT)-like permease
MRQETKGAILALAAAGLSGVAIPANKVFLVGLDPVIFTAARALLIGAVFLLLSSYRSGFRYRGFKKVPWSWLVGIGIIGGGLAFLLYFTGLSLTTSGRAAFLHKTLPVYVAVFAYVFLKERIGRNQGIGMLVMLAGTFAVVGSQIDPGLLWADPSMGDLLVLLGTMLWGVESTLARKAFLKGESQLVVSFGRMLIGGAFLTALAGLFGQSQQLLLLTQQQWLNLLMSTGLLLGYVLCWYWSVRLINVSKASALLLLAPVVSTALGVLWLGEPLPLLQAAGSIIVLAGSVFVLKSRSELATGA